MINRNTNLQKIFTQTVSPNPEHLTSGESFLAVTSVANGNEIKLSTADVQKSGHTITIKDVSGNLSNPIIIQSENNEAIDGWAEPFILRSAFESITLRAQGGEWHIVSSQSTLAFFSSNTNNQSPPNQVSAYDISWGVSQGDQNSVISYNNVTFKATFNLSGLYRTVIICPIGMPISATIPELLQIQPFITFPSVPEVGYGFLKAARLENPTDLVEINFDFTDSFPAGTLMGLKFAAVKDAGAAPLIALSTQNTLNSNMLTRPALEIRIYRL